MLFILYLLSWLFLSSLPAGGLATLVNVTIDDTTGDALTGARIEYFPEDAWDDPGSCADGSPTCVARPDATQLSEGTWHESTFSVDSTNKHPNVPSTATAAFNGSAVYVFCAIPRSNSAPNGNIELTFFLDGVQRDTFARPPASSVGFEYDVPVFAVTDLPPGPHRLTIQNGVSGGRDSLMILDRIVYSSPDAVLPSTSASSGLNAAPTNSSTSKPHQSIPGATAAVIAVLVVAIVILFVVLAVMLLRRRNHRKAIYARYMPQGAVRAFPPDLGLSPASTPRMAAAPSPRFLASPGFGGGGVSMPPPTYAGNNTPNWWVGRDEKRAAGIGTQRVYLDAAQGIQGPQGWERHGHPYASSSSH